jgi:16S rRNA (cytosine1402-N4)-methyltransferase
MNFHTPVLLQEVLEGLRCQDGGVFLDCTVGCGGHTEAILEQHPENCVIGIDRDALALQIARKRLEKFGNRVSLHHERFEHFERVLRHCLSDPSGKTSAGIPRVDGIIFDLGVSSLQLDDPERGFSFQYPARLDMRMDRQVSGTRSSQTAYEIVNTYSADQLAEIFFRYGEDRHSRRIAREIVAARTLHPIETTTQLAELIAQVIPRRFHPKGIHPATRVFQAIRIEVNEELQHLDDTIERAVQSLREGGRICVIAFHSLEDRIVKRTFAKLAKGCQCPPAFPKCVCGIAPSLRILSRKPTVATEEERQQNPRSRSAKLRIAEKIRD